MNSILQPFPRAAFENSLHATDRYPELSCQCDPAIIASRMYTSYESNGFLRQFDVMMSTPAWHVPYEGRTQLCTFTIAPLGKAVSNIVSIGAEKEVQRIDAGGIVTAMQDVKGDTSHVVGHGPRYPRGQEPLTISSTQAELTIAITYSAPLPLPAVVGTLNYNFGPKSNEVRAVPFRNISVGGHA